MNQNRKKQINNQTKKKESKKQHKNHILDKQCILSRNTEFSESVPIMLLGH